ncbi:MAG: 23S rRNA (guanosine(2251)-2'-O)-methyltransferase RlmB [Prevotellaceae bacterium]|jgi:23S rRNA (guanosine2251-2'-O)-methyltransferase|nr:23S rRNA (guanosine(2251)-2'-O)-methyltransferase RlmB [Prevotellaceae bacterium]
MYKTQRRPEREMIFGIHAVIEAIRSNTAIEKILLRRDMSNQLQRELFAAISSANIPVSKVPPEKLNQLTSKNHQGAIAFISPVEFQDIENIVPLLFEQGQMPYIIVLDSITDVRNFGAIVRTAACAGVDAVVVPTTGSAAINADAVKTSAGALLTVPMCRVQNLKNTLRFLSDSGLKLVAVTEKADTDYTSVSYTEPVALILGAEDEGISPEILKLCDSQAAIPLLGTIESLNVSVAAGVAMYEALRQRKSS